ncbi:DUF350 domain-containing protein [Cytophagaceae bacterium DM2B3-1]|uniref:DUF350 domain-containing protein n=1 Tax=Xanthocytophaga flava TaxID=3048013 RepID=A0ABT7CPH4_9BACT|nr:DUF350 domain-containing protein [Xanthocytophaga flavus]MDJ1468788.1 DUF350 domain-containing protein [Xanthocytophaga flavus]MDJ1495648.1 DUF350 domain-containing protein [Xanthocytophaga flavus]
MYTLLTILLQAPGFWEKGIMGTIIYSVIGLIMCVIGFKVVDWLIPGHLARQIAEEKNVAAALVAAALILGICIIIAAAIAG